MNPKIASFYIFFFFCILASCQQRTQEPIKIAVRTAVQLVGGSFENGEFMYIGMPNEMDAVDTSAAWNQVGQKIKLYGKIYQKDGITPAPNVILYYYHTDSNGLYSTNKKLDKRAHRHGYLRGWVKSDEGGNYAIYTVRPAPYPNSNEPAHIHPSIKESHLNEYYIDEFVFDDDSLLTPAKRAALQNRGGAGILKGEMKNGTWVAKRDIILGLNIPNYPEDGE